MTSFLRQPGERGELVAPSLLVLFPVLLHSILPSAQQEPFNISVNVNLVVLHATVRDHRGHDVLNLRQEDFKIYEDGVEQSIRLFRREDTPVTVGLIVDHSGSMREKLHEVTAAARTFARSSNPKDQMFVVNFNERVTFGLARTSRFTDSPAVLENAILGAQASGRTALYDALATGLEELRQGVWDKKVLVVISDGGDNASMHTLTAVTSLAEQSSALIYAIGIFTESDADANPGVLKRLALTTGGEAFFPKQFKEVGGICEHIAADIRNQYMIGYIPNNSNPGGSFRTVRVVARAPGRSELRVRTRTSYATQERAR